MKLKPITNFPEAAFIEGVEGVDGLTEPFIQVNVGCYHDKSAEIRDEIIYRVNAHDALVEALKRSQELFEKALPKFNWGSSFLNAEAIKLLNDVPIEVAKALAAASETRTEVVSDAKQGNL